MVARDDKPSPNIGDDSDALKALNLAVKQGLSTPGMYMVKTPGVSGEEVNVATAAAAVSRADEVGATKFRVVSPNNVENNLEWEYRNIQQVDGQWSLDDGTPLQALQDQFDKHCFEGIQNRALLREHFGGKQFPVNDEQMAMADFRAAEFIQNDALREAAARIVSSNADKFEAYSAYFTHIIDKGGDFADRGKELTAFQEVSVELGSGAFDDAVTASPAKRFGEQARNEGDYLVDFATAGEEVKDNLNAVQEKWLANALIVGNLGDSLERTTQTQRDDIKSLLTTMMPISPDNPFWQRNHEALARAGLDSRSFEKLIDDAVKEIERFDAAFLKDWERFGELRSDLVGMGDERVEAYNEWVSEGRAVPEHFDDVPLPLEESFAPENPVVSDEFGDKVESFGDIPNAGQPLNHEAASKATDDLGAGQLKGTGKENVSVPDWIKKDFVVSNGAFYARDNKDGKVVFVDKGDTLNAAGHDEKTVSALVSIMQERGWQGVEVSGTDEFRAAVWLEMSARGVEVSGYQPTEVDKEKLAAVIGLTGDEKEILRSVTDQLKSLPEEFARDVVAGVAKGLVEMRVMVGVVEKSSPGFLLLNTEYGQKTVYSGDANLAEVGARVAVRGSAVEQGRVAYSVQSIERMSSLEVQLAEKAQDLRAVAEKTGGYTSTFSSADLSKIIDVDFTEVLREDAPAPPILELEHDDDLVR